MSDAYKCDRCEEYSEELAAASTWSVDEGIMHPGLADYDLCPDCHTAVGSFLTGEHRFAFADPSEVDTDE